MTIAVDTSIFILYLQKHQGEDIEILRRYLSAGEAFFPPVVITELLSAPKLETTDRELILSLPVLDGEYGGYWQRAGETRKKILQKNLKAKLGDALIAQSCIDNNVPLLTRDDDFRFYALHCGLKLAVPRG